ncbi:LPS biosynthesis protein WbpP [Candidatus Marinamargulisbacteria bacterium SCGC AAA071-K20]|nr:LPS biosynthesis protein WbpP [Candidatus Marinamargulisbacteria bacterium SCGC AAA071-K20]
MAKYLVTGAAGFIGSNIVEHLLDKGETVVALDNFSTGHKHNFGFIETHPNKNLFKLIEGDVRNLDTCNDACKDIDFVLHQAALGSVPRSMELPVLYEENNTIGTLNMMIAARDAKVKRFVYASSSSVYGDTPTLPKIETMRPTPMSPYAVTKLAKELYGSIFFNSYGLQTIGLRYFNVFGPKQDPNSQYAAAIPKFITSALNSEPITIYGDGEQTRDFTFIDNVIDANLSACTAKIEACAKAYNIGCGERISINDLINNIITITNSTSKPIHIDPRAGDVRDSLASIDLSKKYLGLSKFIKLKEGLAKTIEWYQNK